jgi:Arc/MetJ-type ribon-helix-helix transcriptional regulator
MRDFRIHFPVSFLFVGFVFLCMVGFAANGDAPALATGPTTAPVAIDSDAIAAARQAMLNSIDRHIASLRTLLDQIPADQRNGGEIDRRLQDAIAERARIESATDEQITARIAEQLAERNASAANVPKPQVVNAAAPEQGTAPKTPGISLLETKVVFPGSSTHGEVNAVVQPTTGCELVTLHAPDGTRIVALFGRSPTLGAAAAKPALLYFYGNGACMAYSRDVFNRFRSLGFNVIMADYEGYGMSGGTPSEPGCYAAADAAYNYLLTRNDVDQSRIVATGWSLGAAVAIDLATRRHVAGLVTFSAFTNIT